MGALLAKFRKEKSTTEILEGLEEKITEIEKYTLNTQVQKRRIVGNFVAISIGIYVIAFLIFYFVYFPPTWRERVIYSMPLLIFPMVVILLRSIFSWYFERKLNKNSKVLKTLRAEKKKILEQVMDKETYKVAVKLLARFGDKNQSMSSIALTPRGASANSRNAPTPQRFSSGQSPRGTGTTVSLPDLRYRRMESIGTQSSPQTMVGFRTPPMPAGTVAIRQALVPRSSPQSQQIGQQIVQHKTPFPILNQQNRSVLDRIVDVLIGDGPQDRFGMICKECFFHNGMALKEDFEYTTFRCAFCNALNPSRKARPVAPRLPGQHSSYARRHSSDTSSSTDTDSDYESKKGMHARLPDKEAVPQIELTEATPPLSDKPAAVPSDDGAFARNANVEAADVVLKTMPVSNDELELHKKLRVASEAEELHKLKERFAKMYATPDSESDAEPNHQQAAGSATENDISQSFEELCEELKQQIEENVARTNLETAEVNNLK